MTGRSKSGVGSWKSLGLKTSVESLSAVTLLARGQPAGPATLLSSLLLQALDIHDVSEITQVVYRDVSPKLRIAGVCSIVAAAAASGDKVAARIFEEAGRGLGSMACAAARKLTPSPPLNFSGVGVFSNLAIFSGGLIGNLC